MADEQKAWAGAEQLRPLLVDIADLTTDPQNARLHPERNLDAIEKSLRANGQVKPLVVREGVVYAGNGLLTAAIRVGWTKIAAVDVSHLTKAEAKAYGLMDNKSGDLSEWDFGRVADILKELPEELLDATGFEEFERSYFAEGSGFKPGTADEQGSLDSVQLMACPQCGYAFKPTEAVRIPPKAHD